MQVSLAVSAQNTWSDKFELLGDRHAQTSPARCLVCANRGDSTVTLRRYSGNTVISSLDMDSTMTAVEVPATGMYDVGVATGNYGGTALTITVEQ